MLLIPCPHCGERSELEFHYGGEVVARPEIPSSVNEDIWAQYLFFRDNSKGTIRERWNHIHGCGSWISIERDTVTDKIVSPSTIGQGVGIEKPENGG